MKKLLALVAVLLVFAIGAYATTFIGGGVRKYIGNDEFTSSGIDYVEGRITMGSGLTFDLGAFLDFGDLNPADQLYLFTYLNLDIPISNLEIYVGFSPDLSFYDGQIEMEYLKNDGYVHAGLAVNIQKIRLYAEAVKIVYYSSFNLSQDMIVDGGIQIGF
ncbi:hypothetical protein [Mesoaciditoga sp.]